MIRLIQRRLIIPRGDTGTFTVPALSPGQSDSVGVFTIFDPITKTRVFQKQVELQDGVFNIEFDHGDTVNLQAGDYLWDIKFYVNPIIENGKVIDGTEIDSYYAAFQTPKCEIRETGDDFMVIDGQPAKIEDLNIILAATSAANAAKVAATEQAEIAATKASEAAERLAQMIAAIPTKVSELENDSGYLQEETDPTVPAWAKAQTKPSYTPQEVGALPSNTFIPSKVSDLTDDSGHYIKPANGIPASDLEETYLTQHQDISMKANSADLAAVATSGDYSDLANTPYIPTKTSDLVNDSSYPVDASYVHTDNNYTTAEKEKLTGITAGAEVNVNADWNAISGDAQILNKPTNVSAFTNDAGYLTSFTETDPTVPAWAKEPNKPAYTAAEVNAVNKAGDTMTGALTLPYISQSYRNALRFGTNSNTLEMGINARYDQNYDYGYFTVSSERTSGFTQDAIIRGVKNPRYSNDAANKEYVDNKISTAIGNINSFDMTVVQELPTQDISTHTIYLVPKTGETNDVYDEYVYIDSAWEMVGNTQIDLSNYVQFSNYATADTAGVVKVSSTFGIGIDDNDKKLYTNKANSTQIKSGNNLYAPIVPANQHESTFYALARAAGDTTQKNSANAVGTYTTEAKAAIRSMIGAAASADVTVQDVQINGTSVVENGVANVPYAGANQAGVVVIAPNSTGGLGVNPNNGRISTFAAVVSELKTGTDFYKPVVPAHQHESVFYGLATAAGDATQSQSDNTVGQYTDEAKVAIQTMLDVPAKEDIPEVPVQDVQVNGVSVLNDGVANVPLGTGNNPGVVQGDPNGGTQILSNGHMYLSPASDTDIKSGTHTYKPVTAKQQDKSVFYGLAKAAGDTTQSQSNNTVGTYTETAKGAIQKMLGITDLIAPEENDLVANQAYAIGDMFTSGGKLYKATSAIISGGTIIPTTNCVEITVIDALATKLDAAEAGLKVVRLI